MTDRVTRLPERPPGPINYASLLRVDMIGEIPGYQGASVDGINLTPALITAPTVVAIEGAVIVILFADADAVSHELWADHDYRGGLVRLNDVPIRHWPQGVAWGGDNGEEALSSQATMCRIMAVFPRIEYVSDPTD